MKKRRKNLHAVALGRLGGLVRSEAKRRANRENGRKGGGLPYCYGPNRWEPANDSAVLSLFLRQPNSAEKSWLLPFML